MGNVNKGQTFEIIKVLDSWLNNGRFNTIIVYPIAENEEFQKDLLKLMGKHKMIDCLFVDESQVHSLINEDGSFPKLVPYNHYEVTGVNGKIIDNY